MYFGGDLRGCASGLLAFRGTFPCRAGPGCPTWCCACMCLGWYPPRTPPWYSTAPGPPPPAPPAEAPCLYPATLPRFTCDLPTFHWDEIFETILPLSATKRRNFHLRAFSFVLWKLLDFFLLLLPLLFLTTELCTVLRARFYGIDGSPIFFFFSTVCTLGFLGVPLLFRTD